MTADFKQALRAALLAFAGIALGGFVLIALRSPTVSPYRMAAVGVWDDKDGGRRKRGPFYALRRAETKRGHLYPT